MEKKKFNLWLLKWQSFKSLKGGGIIHNVGHYLVEISTPFNFNSELLKIVPEFSNVIHVFRTSRKRKKYLIPFMQMYFIFWFSIFEKYYFIILPHNICTYNIYLYIGEVKLSYNKSIITKNYKQMNSNKIKIIRYQNEHIVSI